MLLLKCLCVFQERLLGEDGHPRKVHDGEDPNRMGLVLEWVYGTIVSTAEKARDGAKRPLGQIHQLQCMCMKLLFPSYPQMT